MIVLQCRGDVCSAASMRKTNDTRKTLVLHPEDRCGKSLLSGVEDRGRSRMSAHAKSGEVDRCDSVTGM